MKEQGTEGQLNIRDKLLRDTFTTAETFLTCLLVISSVVVIYPGQPRSYWLLSFFLIIGALTPILVKTHEATHPFFIHKLWPRFFLLCLPFWVLALQFFIGLFQNPVETLLVNDIPFRQLISSNPLLPTTTEPQSTWISLFAFGSIFIFCLTVFLIPKSLSYFDRVLPILCMIASLVGIFGYMQKIGGQSAPFFAKEHSNGDFFSIFAYDGHWAAYALLWMTACFCLAIRKIQIEKHLSITKTMAPWYLSGAFLLGYSGLFIQSRIPSSILLFYFGILTVLFSVYYLRRRQTNDQRISFIIVVSILITIAFGVAQQRLFHPQPLEQVTYSIRQSALDMFKENPLFGWGMDSFSHIGGFYQDDLLLGDHHERAFSDMYQMLAEFGLIGIAPLTVFNIWLLIRYLSGSCKFLLSNLLLAACFGVCLLAFFDSPFMSPAVFLSFFVLFFSALRWSDLSQKSVDEIDAGTVVVTNSTLRRIPVYKGKKKLSYK